MELTNYEELANKAYIDYADVAKRYYAIFSRQAITQGAGASIFFLGNHSSGKSSLINWVLGRNSQDVGVAPTDDGFTFIIYGENEEEYIGPAAIPLLPKEFNSLASFGHNLLQHIKVKTYPIEILRDTMLIDSPGMIDAAENTVSREYDFEGVIRNLSELCDLVFFLFDPEKPGTTGETINIFSSCLKGKEFKLRVLLNKCDVFASMYDFARTYGTLCWNLARVLNTKDLPKLLTIYSGAEKASTPSMDFSDFNSHRNDFLRTIANAKNRRRDNLYAQAKSDFTRLALRMTVLNALWRKLAMAILNASLIGLILAAIPFFLTTTLKACLSSASILALTYLFTRLLLKYKRYYFSNHVDLLYKEEYHTLLIHGKHDDLDLNWSEISSDVALVIKSAPLNLPIFGKKTQMQVLEVLDKLSIQ